MESTFELVIRPRKGWQAIDFQDIALHWELLGFLVWRDIAIRYRQTVLGGLWAVLQPLTGMIIFTVVFNRLAGVKSDGAPYPLFAFAGLAVWNFFSTAVSQSSNSLLANQALVSKVYFPRVFIPIASITALLLDLSLSLGLLAGLLLYYHWPLPGFNLLLLPIFTVSAFMSAAGLGLVFSALNVTFRDVKYAVPFFVQMALYVTPVIYPVRYIPHKWQILLALNPMAGTVIGFRYALLGSGSPSWPLMGLSLFASAAMFVAGLFIFRRMERRFADII